MGYRTRLLLSILGQVVPLGVAFILVVWAPNNWYKIGIYAAAIVLVVVNEYVRVCRPLKKFEEIREKQFDYFFKQFTDTARLNGQPADLRVNIMLKKLTLTGWRFYQYYQYKMEGWPDSVLHFSIKCGLCGRALRERSHGVVYRTAAQLESEDFGFSAKESAMVRHVRAIATATLYRERRTIRGHIAYKYFGVLNIDATNEAGEKLLAEPQIQEQIEAFAKFVRISAA